MKKITLRAARINTGLTQIGVLAKAGIARSTLTRWERYETSPSERNRRILCSLYGMKEDEILWEKQM